MRTLAGSSRPENNSDSLTMQTFARTFMDPANSAPTRLPAFPNVEQSAVLALKAELSHNVLTADAAVIGHRSLIMRQPSYPYWTDQNSVSGWLYGWQCSIASAGAFGEYGGAPTKELGGTSDGFQCTVTTGTGSGATTYRMRCLGTSPTNVPILGTVDDGGSPFVYVPCTAGGETASFTAVIVLSTLTGNLTTFDALNNFGFYSLSLERWESGARTSVAQVNGTGIFAQIGGLNNAVVLFTTVTTLPPGFYRLVGVTLAGVTGTGENPPEFMDVFLGYGGLAPTLNSSATIVALQPTANVALMPAFPTPEAATATAPFMATRCTALSVAATNTTAIVNKEGFVQIARMNFQKTALHFTKGMISSLPPAKRFRGALEHGFYVYAPPMSDLDEWLDYLYVVTVGPRSPQPVVNLTSATEVIAISLSDPSTSTTTSFSVVVDFHLEFRSYSQLWPVDVSRRTLEDLHRAIVTVVSSGFAKSGPEPPGRRAPQGAILAVEGAKQKRARRPRAKPAPFIGPRTREWNERQLKGKAKAKAKNKK